jgi:hypothetical protein
VATAAAAVEREPAPDVGAETAGDGAK